MPSGDTSYQARFETVELLERGRDNPIRCRVYAGASTVVAPTSGTVSVYDATGVALVDAEAVTVASSIATYTIPSAILASSSFGGGWRVEWTLVISTVTHVFRTDAMLCRRLLYCPVTEADLARRHHDLSNLRESSRSDYSDEITEAWIETQNDLIQRGNRPHLIMSPASLRALVMERTFALIYYGFHHGTGEDKYLEIARDHEAKAKAAWDALSFVYDEDEDGQDGDDANVRVMRPVVALCSPKGRY